MKIFDKSIKISESLFPEVYDSKKKYRTFHFSFAWKKNKLISIGINNPFTVNGKALKFAQLFNTQKQIKYPYLHAEIDMISRMWGKTRVDGNIKVVVLRLNSSGQLKNSKPCGSCSSILAALNVDNIWWSDSVGNIVNV